MSRWILLVCKDGQISIPTAKHYAGLPASLGSGDPQVSLPSPDLLESGSGQDAYKGDIKKLEKAGLDVHELKGGKRTGQLDLYKDAQGNIYLKAKGGAGEGFSLGININDLP